MNFQAVSVGQKLIEASNSTTGGYLDAAGTPSAALLNEFQFVNDSIGAFVRELKKQGLYDKTLIIITAKHGQSPIDPSLYKRQHGANGTSPAELISNLTSFMPPSENFNGTGNCPDITPPTPCGIGPTEDDVSLLWLTDPSHTDDAVTLLEANLGPTVIGAGQFYYGPSLTLNYHDPNRDPRTPDIIVTPNVGVTYSGSHAKQAEHGGFAHDDTNVVLLLSNPHFKPSTVSAAVGTAQVAPTILKALRINPKELDAVRAEGTSVLPAVQFP
jgi:arylsulfatase A-like enzyme